MLAPWLLLRPSVHPACLPHEAACLPACVMAVCPFRRQIPFVTVVTDLGGAHPTWFHKDVDLCFVPSDPVRKIALEQGLTPDQVRQAGSQAVVQPWREGGSEDSSREGSQEGEEGGLIAGWLAVLVLLPSTHE